MSHPGVQVCCWKSGSATAEVGFGPGRAAPCSERALRGLRVGAQPNIASMAQSPLPFITGPVSPSLPAASSGSRKAGEKKETTL